MYASDGKTLLTTFYEEHRKYTPLAQISPYIQQAIVASEDSRFYEHNGVDAKGVARAFVANQQAGGVSQGASTLTMQYVRMALRDSAADPAEVAPATEQTAAARSARCGWPSSWRRRLSKTQILERYLNSAYFGHRAYGIYAAAQIYFSKTAEGPDPGRGGHARRAGARPRPTYDPASTDQKAATDRRNYVIDRMVEMGYLSPPKRRRRPRPTRSS